MIQRRNVVLSLVALATLIASVMLASGLIGEGIRPSFAVGITATDFYTPSGMDPWGTTFDNNGRVWVAIPGCDPQPMCSAGTPPGTIAVYNPSTSNWDATYQLPAGFAQPFFLAIDAQGMVWFPMPMSNSIGMLNPATQTFQQGPFQRLLQGRGALPSTIRARSGLRNTIATKSGASTRSPKPLSKLPRPQPIASPTGSRWIARIIYGLPKTI